jgi:hypothetical protein
MITEAKVKRAVERYMDSKGYKKVTSREKHEPGCDLVFRYRRSGRYYYVEAKGDSKGKSQMETKLIYGLGQIVTRYRTHRNYLSGLAVPAAWKRRALRKVSRDAKKALRLDVFLVDEDGHVSRISLRECTPRKALHA